MIAFFDTNIVIYATSDDPRRADIAEKLLLAGGWVSVQVLNELVHTSQRKMKHDWERTDALVAIVRNYARVADLTERIHDAGRRIARQYKLAIYDAMIVAAAIEAGCDTLFSEDMHHGLVTDGRLRVVNPFLPA